MVFYSVTASSTDPSDWIRMDTKGTGLEKYTLLLDFNGASATADVEFCVEEDLTAPEAVTHDILNGITASTASDMLSPVSAFRLNLSAYSSGTVTLRVLQS